MTKNEYLSQLHYELKKNDVIEAEDIINEYEQHFAFKMADGYTEEEISAKLGDPKTLAIQFKSNTVVEKTHKRKLPTIIGLIFADIFAGMIFVLLFVWEIIMIAFSLACVVTAICLFGGLNVYSLIPSMPYWCGVLFGISFIALTVLSSTGVVYIAMFMRQLMRSYGRFHHNTTTDTSLPPLAIHPQLTMKINRYFRNTALISLIIFITFFILAMIVSMIVSNSLGFWHTWDWFI